MGHYGISEKENIVFITVNSQMMGGAVATDLKEKFHSLLKENKKNIVVNMNQVDRMNSSGLGILIGGLNSLRTAGGDLKLLDISTKVRELLRITKLDRVFEVYLNEAEAIESFK